MSATEIGDWKDEARQLRASGLSERVIAESVGRSASSVHEAVKDVAVESDSERQRRIADEAAGVVTPGQLDIEGGEVPPEPSAELSLTGPVQLSMFNAGGKRPQSASIKFVGGKVELDSGTAFKKGMLVHGVFLATVVETAQRDKRDKATRQVVTCEQNHKAEIDELVTASGERELLTALFRRLLASDMQDAAELADELQRIATGA